jgi:hypothetical protein
MNSMTKQLMAVLCQPVDQPAVTSNGSTYSAVWLQRNTVDTLLYDVWTTIGY